jgi:hypothetical protein
MEGEGDGGVGEDFIAPMGTELGDGHEGVGCEVGGNVCLDDRKWKPGDP